MKTIASHQNRLFKNLITPAKKILVPIDFSAGSRPQLQLAAAMAGVLKATLVLLYIAETDPSGSHLGDCHLPVLEADLRRLAKKQLAKLKMEEIPPGTLSQSIIGAGRPDREILATAKDLNVDLIVMATHSAGSGQGQLGSTAGRVASLASCPVMLVPIQEPTVPFFL